MGTATNVYTERAHRPHAQPSILTAPALYSIVISEPGDAEPNGLNFEKLLLVQ